MTALNEDPAVTEAIDEMSQMSHEEIMALGPPAELLPPVQKPGNVQLFSDVMAKEITFFIHAG